MPSFKSLAVALAVVAVQADYTIDPNSVSLTIRKSWCASELATCPLICQQTKPFTTEVNTCDPTTLTYGCICGNGLQPNISEYSLTLPYFVCAEWGNQCVTACGSDNACSSDCRQNHPCGAQNPTRANTSSSTSTATGSSTATASDTIYTGLGSSSGSSSSSSSSTSAGMSRYSAGLGMGLTLGGLAAGFFLL